MKPGYKTTEFWGAILLAAITWLDQIQGSLPSKYAAIVSGIIAAGYAIGRGLAKSGSTGA